MLTKVDTLYKRTNTGATQIWYCEIEDNKYRTVSGQEDGKKVTSKWTVVSGKNVGKSNETTDEEQCIARVESMYVDKKKRGYFEDKADIDESRGYFQPMLAGNFKTAFKFDPNQMYYVQPKLNGARCLATQNRLQTRSGKDNYVSCPHILEELQDFFKQYPNVILDGELYNHDLRDEFEEIMSLIRKNKDVSDEDYKQSRENIQYHIYDCYDADDPNLKFIDRFEEYVVDICKDKKYIVQTPTYSTSSRTVIDLYRDEFAEKEYEGQMIRLNTPYENKRTNNLLKRKEFIDEEFEVLEILPGKGNRAEMAGKVRFRMPNGIESRASIKGNFAYATKLLEDKEKYVGGDVTVRYQYISSSNGRPVMPVAIMFYEGKRTF